MKQSEFDPETRLRAAGILFVIALVVAIVQHTSFAPLPHSVDDYISGFAAGLVIAMCIFWVARRKELKG